MRGGPAYVVRHAWCGIAPAPNRRQVRMGNPKNGAYFVFMKSADVISIIEIVLARFWTR